MAGAAPRGRAGLLARFSGRTDGVTAVEFGLLALPFFTIVFAIVETAFLFLTAQILESATLDASRLIRTGQAQEQGFDAPRFRSLVCDGLLGLFDCEALRIRVETLPDFTASAPGPAIDPETGDWQVGEGFDGGEGSSVVLVQVHYKWPTLLRFGYFDLATTADGKHLMSAVYLFKNEPF